MNATEIEIESGLCVSAFCGTVGVFMTVLQMVQFIPQHVEMMVDKSVVGLSPWLLFFNGMYTYLAAIAVVLLPPVPLSMHCSSAASANASHYHCFIASLPLLQMIACAFLSSALWVWYLRYMSPLSSKDGRQIFHIYALISIAVIIATVSLVFLYSMDSYIVSLFAKICGILSALCNIFMWIPQISLTSNNPDQGALSPMWVFSSFVMDIVYTIYLVSLDMHWSIWANNIPDAVLTAALFIMLYRLQDKLRSGPSLPLLASSKASTECTGITIH